MSVYVVIDLETIDAAPLASYTKEAEALVEKFGGRLLIRSSDLLRLEGEWNPQGVALFEFPTRQSILDFYESPEYRPMKELRLTSARARAIVIVGDH